MPDFDNQPIGTQQTSQEVIRYTPEYFKMSEDLTARLQAIREQSTVAKLLMLVRENGISCVLNEPDNFNYLGVSVDDPTKISYLTYIRVTNAVSRNEHNRIWEDKNYRYHSSAGKVIRKFFNSIKITSQENSQLFSHDYSLLNNIVQNEIFAKGIIEPSGGFNSVDQLFTEQEYDQFNNLFRVEGFRQGDAGEVIYVKGHWIADLYNEKNYASLSGSLGNSCMRYSRCKSYFDIYVKNPNICKLAVILNQEGKVQARALVWTVKGVDYYDRIYSTSELIADRLKAHFLVKEMKSCYSGNVGWECIRLEADETNPDFDKRILLDHELYPYMDSLKYLSADRKYLSNDDEFMETNILNCTAGGMEHYRNTEEECECCGRVCDTDDMYYLERRSDPAYGQTLCDQCVVYSEYYGCYISENASVSYGDSYALSCDIVEDIDGENILIRESVCLVDGRYAHQEHSELERYVNGEHFILGVHEAVLYNSEYYTPEQCVTTRDSIEVPAQFTQEHEGEIWETTLLQEHLNLNLI